MSAALIAGCARLPPLERAALKPKTTTELQDTVLEHEPDLMLFRTRGPFRATVHENRELRLSAKERVVADLFVSNVPDAAPLVVFIHGHDSSKAAHASQAMHLASWGIHALTIQLPNKGPWIANGRILARLIAHIGASPDVLAARVEPRKIILVGFSFGATAVAVALADAVPAAGAILLDPAGTGKEIAAYLARIAKPVLVLGADEELSAVRYRDYFYEYIRSEYAELSVKGASHEDAQYPSDYAIANGGSDPNVTEALQIMFTSALTAGVMSLAATGTLDFAWSSYRPAFDRGMFVEPKRK